MTYQKFCKSIRIGSEIAVWIAGVRGAPNPNPSRQQDYAHGQKVGAKLPRRRAKKWASRMVRLNRQDERRTWDRADIRADNYRHAHAAYQGEDASPWTMAIIRHWSNHLRDLARHMLRACQVAEGRS